jgi:hypothetical protein
VTRLSAPFCSVCRSAFSPSRARQEGSSVHLTTKCPDWEWS